MKMPSVMSHNFSQTPKAEIQRSQFNRSHGYKTTFDAGSLIPVLVDEALPGDTFKLNISCFCRLATPIVPTMDNLYIDFFSFFVPNRLVWDNWEKFNGAQDNPGDSTDYLVPQTTTTAVTGELYGSLADYFGIPTEVPGLAVSALPFRCYKLIYNEWFRDQNLQTSQTVSKGDGPDTIMQIPLKRGKRHDYFTSALPWPQKGPAISMPATTASPLVVSTSLSGGTALLRTTATGSLAINQATIRTDASGILSDAAGTTDLYLDPNGSMKIDLANSLGTINALRQAVQIQKLYERDARGGTRYTEIIKAHFGVTSPDARLQRPEYLGGGSFPININPVAQTSSTDATTPQGNLAAYGTASATGAGFVRSFTEHGTIMVLCSVRADLNYQQGLNRMWSRRTRWDFYWPALAHIGEQSILNKEIYAQGTVNPTADAATFGYQERYAEYRYKPSIVSGLFRSNHPQSLDMWHYAQDFTALPTLDSAFIVEDPPIDRTIAVPSEPQFLFDAYFDYVTARPMPTYSVPGMMDRF